MKAPDGAFFIAVENRSANMNTMNEPDQQELSPIIIDGPPWEKKHELGFFVAFIETLKAFLLKPANTFSVMRRTATLGDALVYTVAIQVFTFIWMFAVNDVNPEMLLPQDPEILEILQLPDNISQIMVLVYPFSVILLQFIAAYSVHLALKWRDLQSYDFSLIFRIFAYSSGTAGILILLPVVGGLLSLSMTLYLGYTGLKTIYGLDLGTFASTSLLALGVTVGLYFLLVVGVTVVLLFLSFLV